MQTVKWVVVKLQGDKIAFYRKESGREVTGWQIITPIVHGILWPTDIWTPSRFLIDLDVVTNLSGYQRHLQEDDVALWSFNQ